MFDSYRSTIYCLTVVKREEFGHGLQVAGQRVMFRIFAVTGRLSGESHRDGQWPPQASSEFKLEPRPVTVPTTARPGGSDVRRLITDRHGDFESDGGVAMSRSQADSMHASGNFKCKP
jgi:hypothetical protein